MISYSIARQLDFAGHLSLPAGKTDSHTVTTTNSIATVKKRVFESFLISIRQGYQELVNNSNILWYIDLNFSRSKIQLI